MSSTPPTTNPCPGWCELNAGHVYDSVLSNQPQILVRGHTQALGELNEIDVLVSVVADDFADQDETGQLIEPPRLVLYTGDGMVTVTPDQAEALAVLLHAGADRLRRLEQGER